MNRKQISNFLDKILPGIKFDFKFGSDKQCEGCPALVDFRGMIWINKYTFKYYTRVEQKGILMHEVGHLLIGDFKSPVDAEFYAQVVAIQLAKRNKWSKIRAELKETLIQWANDYSWNTRKGEYRKYILAGRRYKCLKDKRKLS